MQHRSATSSTFMCYYFFLWPWSCGPHWWPSGFTVLRCLGFVIRLGFWTENCGPFQNVGLRRCRCDGPAPMSMVVVVLGYLSATHGQWFPQVWVGSRTIMHPKACIHGHADSYFFSARLQVQVQEFHYNVGLLPLGGTYLYLCFEILHAKLVRHIATCHWWCQPIDHKQIAHKTCITIKHGSTYVQDVACMTIHVATYCWPYLWPHQLWLVRMVGGTHYHVFMYQIYLRTVCSTLA